MIVALQASHLLKTSRYFHEPSPIGNLVVVGKTALDVLYSRLGIIYVGKCTECE